MARSWAFDHSLSFVDAAQRATSVEDLTSAFSRTVHALGFQEYLAISLADPDNWPSDAIALSGYDPAWQARYRDERYYDVDPFLAEATRSLMPFRWSDVRERMILSPKQKALMLDAASCNHRVGMTVPIVTPGRYRTSVSVCADRHDLSGEVPHAVHLMSIYLTDAVHRLLRREQLTGPIQPGADEAEAAPTPREREILKWLAAGKTAWEISEILSISERTVRFHIDNTKRKFGVATTMQAVVRALIDHHISG